METACSLPGCRLCEATEGIELMKTRKKFNLPNWERRNTTKPVRDVGSISCYTAHITSDPQGCKRRTEIRRSNFVPSCIRTNLVRLN